MNGTPDANEVMVHKGRLVTSDRRKADIFASHYAGSLALRRIETRIERQGKCSDVSDGSETQA